MDALAWIHLEVVHGSARILTMQTKMLQIIIENFSRLMLLLSTDSLRKKNCAENKLWRDLLQAKGHPEASQA